MRPNRIRLWIVPCLLLVLAAAFLNAAPATDVKYFTGTDPDGDFQTALENAVTAALGSVPCCDRRIVYKVVKTKGTAGEIGPAMVMTIEVTIRVNF